MDVAQKEAECAMKTSEAKIKSDSAVREQREEANRRAAEADAKDKLRLIDLAAKRKEAELAAEAEVRARRAALDVREAEEKTAAAIKRTELAAMESAAELAAFENERLAKEKRAELSRFEAAIDDELRRVRVETARIEGHAQAELALAMAKAQAAKAEAEARMEIARNLPALANAIGSRIGEVKIAQYGGDGAHPFAMMLGGLNAVLETFGASLKRKD
jgi:colicin import membrane protein